MTPITTKGFASIATKRFASIAKQGFANIPTENLATMTTKDFAAMISSGEETGGAGYLARYDPGNMDTGLSMSPSQPWPSRRVVRAIAADHPVALS